MKEVTVILPSGRKTIVEYGTRVQTLLNEEEFRNLKWPVAGVFVNNELTSLSYKIGINTELWPVTLDTHAGSRIYRDSLCYILTKSAKKLFSERRLVISNSLGNSYYFHFDNMEDVSKKDLAALETEMRVNVEKNLPITRHVISYQDAVELFSSSNFKDTYLLLKFRNDSKIAVYECEDYTDLAHTPLAPDTGMLKTFEIRKYSNGFLLRYPEVDRPDYIKPFKDIPVLASVFQEYKAWGKIQNFSSVGELNEHIAAGRAQEIIRVAESLHNKKIGQISDRIAEKSGKVKIVLIAGPSSSGKTTFSKKLSTQLRVVGLNPYIISLDDYYVDREFTPKDASGEYDFESIDAIDIKLFNHDLLALFSGHEVELPSFDFMTGKRVYKGHKITMDKRSILVIEGIHGLNEKLTSKIDHDLKHKIYISALTQLNLDDHNRIPTTDNRLLRRMVRDYQYRGYSALETLTRWPSVRNGENRNIFPFQENADSVFNSALDYELSVLKTFAEPVLKTVKPYHELYSESVRLHRFLSNFDNIPARYVPRTSILREFIGESGFKY